VKPTTVEEYISHVPEAHQSKLRALRAVILETAPEAEERISYGIPYYDYKGRLVYFQLSSKHIGLYVPPPVIAEHKEDLLGYDTSTSAVRLPIDEDLPVALIQKLIKARMKMNDAG
jgi:uncharacterized protein YdhG (YjbR/CyaY superfamily)